MTAIATERKCTNVYCLVFCIILVSATLILVGICALMGSTSRGTRVDRCGNFCGEKNSDNPYDKCGPRDLRKFPILHKKHCIAQCPTGYTESHNKCYNIQNNHRNISSDGNNSDEFENALKKTWTSIAMICFVAVCFSYVCLILLRYAAIYVIWIINIAFVLFGVFLTCLFIYAKNVVGAALMGIGTLISIGLLYWFRKRIRLVGKLFKETSKALMDVPSIMFEPILTLISLIAAFTIFVTFHVVVDESMLIERIEHSSHKVIINYKQTPIHKIASILNLFTFIWFTQFIIGCQHFVIAGTITRWYFTRDKSKVDRPIRQSFWHLMRYHLGSICMGSMLITIVKVMRALVAAAKQQSKESRNPFVYLIACCLKCILELLEELLEYLVRNAYIIVAKDGTGFMDSGKRAYHLLSRNIMDVIALNNFGDIVLAVCRLLIVLIAGFVGFEILNTNATRDIMILPLFIGIVLAFLIAHCFVTVFEMTVDTIFVCYCIDIEENDGEGNPYYMSDSLRKIMTEMKEFSGEDKSNGGMEAGPGMADGSCIPMLPQQSTGYPPIDGQNMNYYGPPPYPGPPVCQQQPYPQDGYQGQSLQYPGQPMQYPGQPMQHPGQPMSYPGQPMQYAGPEMQYPGQQPPYPSQNIPYADQHTPYHQDRWETEPSEKQLPYPSSSYPPINYNRQ
ncbi:choline transporter-like protein 1 [Chironomus tepperi]|uniref:choline transporter-like protein 1 n=1 Tax=Chironomus tepperi TaxID=113505 RepID=UPI00391FA6F5